MICANMIAFGKAVGGSKLPNGVELIDYISGIDKKTSYVELGIVPNFKDTYEFETIVYDTNFANVTICAALDTDSEWQWFFIAQTFNNRLDLNYGANGSDDVGKVCFVNEHIMSVKSYIANGVQRGWVKDITAGTDEELVTDTNFTAPIDYQFSSQLRLLNRTNILANGVKKIGRTKLRVNGELLFDLYPCLDGDNNYEMWNAVDNKFMELKGEFTGGFWDD